MTKPIAILLMATLTAFASAEGDAPDLRQAIFTSCKLDAADFTEAKLEHATFCKANLRNAVFAGADLSSVIFDEARGAPASKQDGKTERRPVPVKPVL